MYETHNADKIAVVEEWGWNVCELGGGGEWDLLNMTGIWIRKNVRYTISNLRCHIDGAISYPL